MKKDDEIWKNKILNNETVNIIKETSLNNKTVNKINKNVNTENSKWG